MRSYKNNNYFTNTVTVGIAAKKNKICPVEVKSSSYNTHASLDAFKIKYSDRILDNYMVYTKDLRKDGDILLVPTFMTMFL